jgi:prepilin-type N-terminal cleavage/methylation domain-containing protein
MNRATRIDRSGFTLIELTVVISVIVLAMGIALPTLLTMFSAGADKQAENVFSSLCTAARIVAIRDSKYTCVHGQIGTGLKKGVVDTFYLAICEQNDPNNLNFRQVQGFDPQRLPGDMCLGAVSVKSVSGGSSGTYIGSVVDDPKQFACFNVIFSPSGRVVSLVNNSVIQFASDDLVFSSDPNMQLWDLSVANANSVAMGVSAVTLFPYGQYLARKIGGNVNDLTSRLGYINTNGQFLPINYYTGQMFPRR